MTKEVHKMKLAQAASLALIVAMSLTTSILPAAGQKEAAPDTSESWRKNPPKPTAPRKFELPSIESYKLKNGLTVDLVEDHRFPFYTMIMGFKVGNVQDPPGLSGTATITASMLNQGTPSRTAKQIADRVDFIGGGLGNGTDPDFTIVNGSSLSRYSDELFDIYADTLRNPTFPQSELDLRKTNVIQELTMKRSDPDFLLEERFHKVLFGKHPYSVISPTKESVEKITRADLVAFHKKNYVPNVASLVVIGDFDSAKIKAKIEKNFGDNWQAGAATPLESVSTPTRDAKHVYLVDRPGSVQSNIKLGNIAIQRTDPDFFPMLVANQVLGGAAGSRLFMNLREQKSFTYGAYSGVMARRQPGSFYAEAAVRKEVTGPSLKEFFVELDRIRNEKVADKELSNAKQYLSGSFQLGLETQGGLAQRLIEAKLYGLPADFLSTYADRVMAVTADDVERVARKHIDVNNMAITVVGDAKTIKPELEKFAPVDTYDVSGKLSSEAPKTTKSAAGG